MKVDLRVDENVFECVEISPCLMLDSSIGLDVGREGNDAELGTVCMRDENKPVDEGCWLSDE